MFIVVVVVVVVDTVVGGTVAIVVDLARGVHCCFCCFLTLTHRHSPSISCLNVSHTEGGGYDIGQGQRTSTAEGTLRVSQQNLQRNKHGQEGNKEGREGPAFLTSQGHHAGDIFRYSHSLVHYKCSAYSLVNYRCSACLIGPLPNLGMLPSSTNPDVQDGSLVNTHQGTRTHITVALAL